MPQPPRDRKDHYVPQGYLRGFIDPAREQNDRPLWCLDKRRNEWVRKAPAQICHVQGMYDFSNDAIEAEHADVTFKSLEDGLPAIRETFIGQSFEGWLQHIDFLLPYMQMIRVRSPQFFVEQGQAVADSYIGTITSIDETRTKVTYDNSKPLTEDQVHNMTLVKMREEFAKGPSWMADMHWQIRATFDPHNPVVTSEQPLFVKGEKPQTEPTITMDLITDSQSEVYFPLCWQACIVGRSKPFDEEVVPFEQDNLLLLRHMIAEMAPEYVIAPQIVEDLILDGRPKPTVKQRR
jgi:Protein of unknown function (DUF4238)